MDFDYFLTYLKRVQRSLYHSNMAQVLKQEIKQKIIATAKKSLIEKGFLSMSMRDISKNSQTSLSNIYNYFPSKDALLEGVLEDTLNEFSKANKKIENTLKNKKQLLYLNFDKSQKYAGSIIDFILKHQENLYILSFKSSGSKLENFIDDWSKEYAKMEYQSLKLKAKGHKDILKQLPSEFFIQSLCGFFFKSTKDLVKQDFTQKELKKYLEEIFSFIYQGWEYYIEF